jgi:hypothetical protein
MLAASTGVAVLATQAIVAKARSFGLIAIAPGHNPPAPMAEPVPVPEPLHGPVAEADHYATLYPRRAALPAKCDFAPPEAYLVHAIVTDSARPCERSTVPRRPPRCNLACPPLSPRAPLSPP